MERASVEQAGLSRARHQLRTQPCRIVQALARVVVQQADEGQHLLHRHPQALQVGRAGAVLRLHADGDGDHSTI